MNGLLAVLASMLISFTPAGGSEAPVRAWLEAEQSDRSLHVIPYAQSRETLTLRYELTSVKNGRAGQSSSRQAGHAVVTCCAPQALTRLRFTFDSGDRYTVILKVFNDQVLIGEERLVYPREVL
jgi:hypothetical protein